MSQPFRRKLQIVFGIAVCASMGFGAAQVKASPAEAEGSRLACQPGQVRCDCGDGPFCARGWICPPCN